MENKWVARLLDTAGVVLAATEPRDTKPQALMSLMNWAFGTGVFQNDKRTTRVENVTIEVYEVEVQWTPVR